MNKQVTRRRLLQMLGLGVAGVTLAACGPSEVTKIVKETVVVEGTPQVIEKVVKETVQVEKVVTQVIEKRAPVTIRWVGLDSMSAGVEQFLQPWLEETGNKFERGVFSQQELTDKIMQAVATGTHLADVVQAPSNARGDIISAGALLPVSETMLDQANFYEDVLPSIQRSVSWEGKVYALPYDGDFHYSTFRKDLFADPEINSDFKEKYGYDLDPKDGAKTWAEWRNIGEFFTGWDWNKNGKEDDFGLSAMTKRGDTAWWGFNSRTTAYGKHPDDPGYFLDIETGEARVNSPAFVRALTEWAEENQRWAPPGGTNFTYGDSSNAFNGGRVVQTYNWDAVAGAANPETSVIKGLAGYNLLPGSTEVFNSKTGEWEDFPEVNYAPYHANGGWVIAVLSSTDNDKLDTIWDMLTYVTSPESSLWFVTNPTGCGPFRYSHLEAVDAYATSSLSLGEEVARDYLAAARASLEHPNYVSDMAILGWVQYRDVLELAIARVLAGEMPAQQALDEAKAEFDTVSERMGGKQRQAEVYRLSLGV